MGTIAEKLTYLADTKTAIRAAIEDKGITVSDSDTFRSYADKISGISGGGVIYEYMPVLSDVNWYYDATYADNKYYWKNLIGDQPIIFTGANFDNSTYSISGTSSSYGHMNNIPDLSTSITLYVVAKCPVVNSLWVFYAHMKHALSGGNYGELTVQAVKTYNTVNTSSYNSNLYPNDYLPPENYTVTVIRTNRTANTYNAFFNGIKSNLTGTSNTFQPTLTLGAINRDGSYSYSNSQIDYKFIAISAGEHTDEEVVQNSEWLMNRFEIAA